MAAVDDFDDQLDQADQEEVLEEGLVINYGQPSEILGDQPSIHVVPPETIDYVLPKTLRPIIGCDQVCIKRNPKLANGYSYEHEVPYTTVDPKLKCIIKLSRSMSIDLPPFHTYTFTSGILKAVLSSKYITLSTTNRSSISALNIKRTFPISTPIFETDDVICYLSKNMSIYRLAGIIRELFNKPDAVAKIYINLTNLS